MELSIGQAVSGMTQSDQTRAYIGFWTPVFYQKSESIAIVKEEDVVVRKSKPEDFIHSELSVSPNPFSDYTIIDLKVDNPSDVSIIIYDSVGRLVDVVFKGFYKGPLRKVWKSPLASVASPLVVVCTVNKEVIQKMLIQVD
jgi:hypothetical protein